MWEKIFDFIIANPFLLIPFIVTIPMVHLLKKFIKESDPIKKIKKTIGVLYAISFLTTILPTIKYNLFLEISLFEKIINMIIYQLGLSVVCMIFSAGIVILFDKAIEAGLLDSIFSLMRNLIKSKEQNK